MNEEKLRILQMIQEGKVSAAEGLELLEALEESRDEPGGTPPAGKARFFRVRVYGEKVPKVNVNIPLSLLKIASKFAHFGMSFIPEEARRKMEEKGVDLSRLDLGELAAQIEEGLGGIGEKLVDVDIDDPEEGKMRVEVYVE